MPEYVVVFECDYVSGVCSCLGVYAYICVYAHMFNYVCMCLMYTSEFTFACTHMFMALSV